jgi:predicted ATPase
VFVSSTLAELAAERRAAKAAIEHLRLIPVMFELGARPHPARALYRAYLDQSNVFVGIYWQRYGWVAPGEEISGLEDEYELSAGLPRLVYLREPAPEIEPRLEALIQRIQADDTVAYKRFSTPDELEKLVAEDLALLLSERFLAEAPAESSATTTWGVRLPVPPSPIVDREDELRDIAALLDDPNVRMVTLVGPGGIGKTRLGLEAARAAASSFADGAVMVRLDVARDDREVMPLIGAAMGINLERTDAADLVAGAIGSRRVLLFLDNFEHVLDAAVAVSVLLERCPRLTLLVTSRMALALRAEHTVMVPPLGLPFEDERDPAQTPAVRLFVERAARVQSDFALTDHNREAVYELCRRLDGIPLAIELAAARVRFLDPVALLERLDARFEILEARSPDMPERQRTLRATIEWSYELLTDDERRLLARLSVFEDGCTLEAAERVCNGDLDVLDALSGLVEHSLVTASASEASALRFRMFDMIRAFARDRLEASGEADDVREKHLVYFAEMADEGRDRLRSVEHRRWFDKLTAEWGNARAAWQFALQVGDGERAVAVASAAYIVAWAAGRLGELAPLIEETLRYRDDVSPTRRGRLLFAAAATNYTTGRHDAAEAFFDELDEIGDEVEDRTVMGGSKLFRAFLASDRWDPDAVHRHLAEAEARLAAAGDTWTLVFVYSTRGAFAMVEGDLDQGIDYHQQAFDLACQSGNELAALQSRVLQAVAALALDKGGRAREWLADAISYLDEYPYSESSAYAYEAAAGVATGRGDAETAARLIGAADMVRDATGVKVWSTMRPLRERIVADVEQALGPSTFRRLRDDGTRLGPPQANALLTRVVR